MPTDTRAAVVTDDAAEALWFNNNLLLVRLAGEHTGGQLTIIEGTGRRGSAPPWHRHLVTDETFHVLDGEVTFWCGDPTSPTLRARPGDTTFLPRQIPHTFRVDSADARWLAITSPAGDERFFRETGEPASSRTLPLPGPPDIAAMRAAAARFDLEILGPPPTLDNDRIM